jgi:dihydropteroate synthase
MMAIEPSLTGAPARRWTIDARRGLSVATPAALMGIINATPDSFSDGARHAAPDAAEAAAARMRAAGAAWLDVGGESTRPGAPPVGLDEELARVIPVVRALHPLGLPISVDTAKAEVARRAIAAGAVLVNDVSAGADPAMFAVVAEAGCPVVLMHMQGTPATMQRAPAYADVVDEVRAFLAGRLAAAVRAGVREDAVLLDPGIGFGKTLEHNLALLRALPRLAAETARPLLLGVSRKAFLAAAGGVDLPPWGRDGLSHVAHAALAPWCALLRVHDVAGAAAALRLAAALRGDAPAAGVA